MSGRVKVVSFVGLFFTGLAMCPYIAHLMSLPNKMAMSEQEYFVAQQAYHGWSYSGILILVSFVSTALLSILARENRRAFCFVLGSSFCIGVSLVVFFMFGFPANQVTDNWTVTSPNWEILRTQWEYSHAFSALLYMFAEALIILSVLSWPVREEFHSHPV